MDRRDAIFKVVVVMKKDAGDYEAELKAFMLYGRMEGQWRGNHPNFKDEARWWCWNKQLRSQKVVGTKSKKRQALMTAEQPFNCSRIGVLSL